MPTPALEAALYSLLTSDPAVAALVDSRVFPIAAEKPAVPFVVYDVTGGSDDYTRGGYSGLKERRVVLNVVAANYQKAIELAEVVKAAIPLWGGRSQGVELRMARLDAERDYLAADAGKVTPVGRQLTFTIKYVVAEQPAPEQEQP